jgi:hypothetical protein
LVEAVYEAVTTTKPGQYPHLDSTVADGLSNVTLFMPQTPKDVLQYLVHLGELSM